MADIKLGDVSEFKKSVSSDANTGEMHDLDSILIPLGGFGKFQWFNMACICCIIVLCVFCELGYVFTAAELKHRCLISECEAENSTYSDADKPWLKYAISKRSTGDYDSCYRHNRSVSEQICSSDAFSTKEVYQCDSYIFETEEWTIAREDWGPRCDDDMYLLSLVGSVNNAGQVIGGLVAGYLQDRYGRKVVLVSLALIVSIVGTIKSFSVNYAMMLSFEALESAAAVGLFNGPFVLALEIVDPTKRVLAGFVVSMAYPLGEVLLGLVQYLTFDWRTTIRICYAPFLLSIAFYWILPESVRWLLANERHDDAIGVLRKIATMNGAKFPEEVIKKILVKEAADAKQAMTEQKNKYRLKDIWNSKIMRWRTFCTLIVWISSTFVFFAITMNSVGITDDKFLNFILTALIEVPSYLFVFFVLDRLGRKYTAVGMLLLCGVACLGAAYVPDDVSWARLLLYLMGKSGAAGSVFSVDLYTTELFPTFMRSTIMTVGLMVGKIASIVAPEVPLLDEIYKPLPLLVFSGMAIIGAVSLLPFPETLNTQLPETVEDAENLGKRPKGVATDR